VTAAPSALVLPDLSAWSAVLVMAPALAAAVGSALVSRSTPATTTWRIARTSTFVALASAVAVGLVRAVSGSGADALVRVDNITVVMLGLIALIGAVVVHFSSAYLAGDPFEQRYARRLLATLAAVSVVVVANHLVLLAGAWAAASLSLHGLLVHFGERPAAVAVAHKKFLLARVADACMVGAIVAFGSAFSTLRLDAIADRATAASSLPGAARTGVVLVAVAALLKCAQLPFHGWLIQVMEAPTPVSALLHAGVVNLGGVVLLRFAPVVDRAVEARSLLVAAGVATAVVAAVVMTTRVSVKVALAWSTCAQMGFMLMQCGLGIWEMALVHLVAHSVYKAYAFLGAGGTVRQAQRRQLAGAVAVPTPTGLLGGAATALAATVVVTLLWALIPGTSPLPAGSWVLLGIVGLALVPVTVPLGSPVRASIVMKAVLVPVVYLALHEAAGRLVPHASTTPVALLVATSVGFAALFAIAWSWSIAPGGLARRMRPWIYSGLFLDEAFTRLAFGIAHPPAPTPRPALLPQPAVVVALDRIDA
jgi:NAD(P)H-quinone oxidoreductase subunit 5